MKKPNFFILGAPKCGTTSLANWLAEHPNIFISPMKEPNFFNTDMANPFTYSLEAYEQLFTNANFQHLWIGEASTNYLFSKAAVPNILNYVNNPSDVKFIVSIRNPIDMTVSWHGEMLRSGNEVVKDFPTAWHLQESRSKGLFLPAFSEQDSLLYGPLCRLGEQLQRLLNLVNREQVHVVVLDDIKSDPQLEYTKILTFLRLPHDGKQHFPIHNAARTLPSWAARLSLLVIWAKGRLNIRSGLGVNKWLVQKLYRTGGKKTIGYEMFSELREYFKDDIVLLSQLLDRDFAVWLEFEMDSHEDRTN